MALADLYFGGLWRLNVCYYSFSIIRIASCVVVEMHLEMVESKLFKSSHVQFDATRGRVSSCHFLLPLSSIAVCMHGADDVYS